MSSEANLATLVIASYNHAPYIDKCLESVALQTLENVAIIVTDDASQDESTTVLDDSLVKHGLSARKIYHETNQGICATFNDALKLVDTPYVAYLAADDWMAEERLERQVRLLENEPPSTALTYSDAWIADASGGTSDLKFSNWASMDPAIDHSDRLFEQLLRGNWIPAPSVLLRTDALRAVGGYDPTIAFEDYDIWLRLAKRYSFSSCDAPLVYYRSTPGGMEANFASAARITFLLSQMSLLAKHLGYSPETDRIIHGRTFKYAVEAYRLGAEPAAIHRYFWLYFRAERSVSAFVFASFALLGFPGSRLPSTQSIRSRIYQ